MNRPPYLNKAVFEPTFGRLGGEPAIRMIGHALVVLCVFSGFFVLFEPAPYELIALLLIVFFLVIGMPVRRELAPMIFLLLIYTAFGFPAATQAREPGEALFYVTVSAFLVLTSIFFAAYVANNPIENTARIRTAYIASGLLAAATGIVGYLGLVPGAEVFTLFGRAKGTFQDPNVLGPFLILPTLCLLLTVLTGRAGQVMTRLPLLMFLLIAVFFTFSRGAWVHLIVSAGLMVGLHFLLASDPRQRFRILIMAGIALGLTAALLLAALSVESISNLFRERAVILQTYDDDYGGRFSRQARGFELMLERPLGLGALEFGKVFFEDPHNVYLKAFSVSGWIGGAAYLALVALTLVRGTAFAFTSPRLRMIFLPFFAAFAGLALLGLLIDTDRWRHFHLLLGVLWGIMAAGRAAVPYTAAPGIPAQQRA